VVEGSACNCFCPMWKPIFHTMATKVSRTTSWVPCAHCHGHNIKGAYPYGQWDVCTHIGGSLQLKDMVIQTTFETLWRKVGKIIKRLGRLVKL